MCSLPCKIYSARSLYVAFMVQGMEFTNCPFELDTKINQFRTHWDHNLSEQEREVYKEAMMRKVFFNDIQESFAMLNGVHLEMEVVSDLNGLQKGDHLCANNEGLVNSKHHFVLSTLHKDGTFSIIHLTQNMQKSDFVIQTSCHRSLRRHFESGALWRMKYSIRKYPPSHILQRARSRLNWRSVTGDPYDIVHNNCEHFASWAVCGLPVSEQSNRWGWVPGLGHIAGSC